MLIFMILLAFVMVVIITKEKQLKNFPTTVEGYKNPSRESELPCEKWWHIFPPWRLFMRKVEPIIFGKFFDEKDNVIYIYYNPQRRLYSFKDYNNVTYGTIWGTINREYKLSTEIRHQALRLIRILALEMYEYTEKNDAHYEVMRHHIVSKQPINATEYDL